VEKRSFNIIEDNVGRMVWIELERGFISGKSELICCFHKQPPVLFGQSYHVAGGEERKRSLGNPDFEDKNGTFQN